MAFDFGIDNMNDQIVDSLLNDSDIKIPDASNLKPLDEEGEDDKPKDNTPALPNNEDVVNSLLGEENNEEDDENKNQNIPANNSNVDSNVFENLSNELVKLNIFTEDEDEEGNPIPFTPAKTPEEFQERFSLEIRKQAANNIQNFLSKFGEDRQALFDAIFVNGVDPKEYLPKFNEIQDFSSLDISTDENQEKVVREYFKRQGLDEARISKKIQNLRDLNELQEEATFYFDKIIAEDTQALSRIEEERRSKLEANQKAHLHFSREADKLLRESLKTKEFEGFPITEKIYREALDYITTAKYRDKTTGELVTELDKDLMELKNPENLKKKVILGLLSKNNWDLSKIKTKAISKETNDLFGSLVTQKNKTNPTKTNSSDWTKNL